MQHEVGVLDSDGLAHEHEQQRAPCRHDAQWFVRRVEHQCVTHPRLPATGPARGSCRVGPVSVPCRGVIRQQEHSAYSDGHDAPRLPRGPPVRRRRHSARHPRPRPLPLAGGPGQPGDGRLVARAGRPAAGRDRCSARPRPAGGAGRTSCSARAPSARRPGAATASSSCAARPSRSTPYCSPSTRTAPSGCSSTRSPSIPPAPPRWTPGSRPRRATCSRTSSPPAAPRSRCCTSSTS